MIRTGRLLGRAVERLFRHIAVEDQWIAEVRAAAARGSVVYVLRSASALLSLATPVRETVPLATG